MTYWRVTWHKLNICTDLHSDISFPRSSVRRCIALLSNLQTLLPFAENGSGRGTVLTSIPTGLVVLSCVHALHEMRVRGSQDFKRESIGKCMVLLNQCHIPSVSASFLSLDPIILLVGFKMIASFLVISWQVSKKKIRPTIAMGISPQSSNLSSHLFSCWFFPYPYAPWP